VRDNVRVPQTLPLATPGAELQLLADRALFWSSQQALIVADVHFGKAAAFRAHALPIPGGSTEADLERLDVLIKATGAKMLLILGDMWHAKEGMTPSTLELLEQWRTKNEQIDIVLVMGNHDQKCGNLPSNLRIRCVPEPYMLGGLTLAHDPRQSDGVYTLAGHIHPCVALDGRGRQSQRLPCFWFGQQVGVLPAFGSFTGCGQVKPKPVDRVIVIASGELVEMPTNLHT
jgi:DNA ligase-associated metallophosphoesterase